MRLTGLSIGTKHSRTDDDNSKPPHRKKAKPDSVSKKPGRAAKVRVARPPKVNAAVKAALKEKEKEGQFFHVNFSIAPHHRCKIALVTHPKWHTLIPSTPETKREETPFTKLRPRLWTSVCHIFFYLANGY
jgi:hypothetical protein